MKNFYNNKEINLFKKKHTLFFLFIINCYFKAINTIKITKQIKESNINKKTFLMRNIFFEAQIGNVD